MSQNDNEIDIGPMLNDINKVLKGHLSNLLGPIINEKNAIMSVLLNMPYVKKLKQENNLLKRNIFQLKTELESTKNFYEKELENASKKNVKLEVRDSLSNQSETPSKIVELKREMWRKNEKVNSQDDLDEDEDEDDEYNNLYGEEDENDDSSDDDDAEEYESPIITNLKMSMQNSEENNVEITSNGTVESNEDKEIKNVTVWNLNKEGNQNAEEEDRTFWTEIEKDVKDENNKNAEKEENVEEDNEEEDEEDEDEEEDEDNEDEEDEEEDEEEDQEEDEEEEEEEVVDDEEEDEELDVEDVEIDGVQYLTTSTESGEIYKCDDDGEIMEDENGDFIICGYFKNGIANFI